VKYSRNAVSIRVRARACGPFVEIRVKDDGLGIDPATRRNLFRRFYRGDQAGGTSGLGLGLSIVKEIVELHGGRIRVRSRPGRGTEVVLSFPRFDPRRMLTGLILEGSASPLGRVGGIGFVRAEMRACRGAVRASRQEALARAREILTRTMGVQDVVLGGCASRSDAAICFLLPGSRSRLESSIEGILRTLSERLCFQSGIQVDWEENAGRLHSDDFGGAESMAEAILQRWFQPKESR
ncbi:MAG: sensor histidine kinase, partial [Candidatus Eisenbacteria bacterium]|nr:sensor histidine kinase [Candidatus Eisenbacteria bacterium]